MSAGARGASLGASLLCVAALSLVASPSVATASAAPSDPSSSSVPSPSEFSFLVKDLLAAGATAEAARADGSEGLLEGLSRAGARRRLAGSDAVEATSTPVDADAGDVDNDDERRGNRLASALLLNRLRANLRGGGEEVRSPVDARSRVPAAVRGVLPSSSVSVLKLCTRLNRRLEID